MSEKKRWPRSEALVVAEEIISRLTSCCKRIAIAGSLRRGKSDVGDIEDRRTQRAMGATVCSLNLSKVAVALPEKWRGR